MSCNEKSSEENRKGKTLFIKAGRKESNETGAKAKCDPAEDEVRTKLDQVLVTMREADQAKDGRLRVPRGLNSLAKAPEMVPWLLNLVEYERHSILRRYNLPCTFRCCGGFSSRLSRGPSRWNTRLTATGRPSDAAALRVLPAAESMRLAKRAEDSLKEASRLYCRLMLRISTLGQKRPGCGGRHQAWRTCMEDSLINQNLFENLYFLICRVVVGCLRDYHPPRSIFTAARIDQLVAADLGRLLRSTSFNLHGRTLKARRLLGSNEGRMESASEDSEEDQGAAENRARGMPPRAKGQMGETRSINDHELRITSPVTQELIKATRKRVKASRRQRRSSVDGLLGDKKMLEQGIDGSKFVDFNNLIPLQDRRSPLMSILLPSPREVALKIPDFNSARTSSYDQRSVGSLVQSARTTAKLMPSSDWMVATPRLHSARIRYRKVVAVELCRRGWRKPPSEKQPSRPQWVNPS